MLNKILDQFRHLQDPNRCGLIVDAGVEERSGRVKQQRFLIFNPPWHLVVTNFHFTQDGMTMILFVFRWYQIGHAVVHHYVSVFGMLAHWKPKYRRYVILCCLVVLIFYPWLNRGLPQTIVLSLPTSRIHLRITLFITCQDPLAEEVDLLLSHAKGFMFPEIRLYFFFVRTFWFSYHLWFKVFRLVTVYRPPPSKKNGFTVERFFSEFSALSEELTVTFCQFLLCGDFNFHVDIDSNANAKQFSDPFLRLICHPLCELIGNTPWNWWQSCEKAVCAVKCALTSAAAVLAYFVPQFPVELWVDASPYGLGAVIILVYLNGNRRLIAYASQTLKEHDKALSYNIRFVLSKRNTVADVLSRLPLPSTFNEDDAIYRVEERLVHLLPITNKEISYATRVDTVLSRT